MWTVVENRIRGAEREERRRAGSVQNTDTYQFLISATCPPSTSISFRGGMCWYPSSYALSYGYYIPSYTVDLTDSDKVSVRVNYSSYTYTFTNANWYIPCFIVLSGNGLGAKEEWPTTVPDNSIYLQGTTSSSPYMEEFETYREAEDELLAAGDIQVAENYGIVSSGLILRNNGNTTEPNQYMEVDSVNRGRSYLYWNTKSAWEMG